jgi:hypothetical protein
VRLWLNDAQAASGFGTTVDGVSGNYYLRSGGGLGATQGAGPKTTVDVSLNSKQKCSSDPELDRPFTSLGDWSITLP